MTGRGRRRVLATLLTLALAVPAGAGAGEETLYEVWYTLEAEVRRLGGRADVRAGGRLLMSAVERAPGAARRLELVRPLEDPWKLFSVDPLGPFRGETKVAVVTTLREASWQALEEAQSAIDRIGLERHAEWAADGGTAPLDGAFGFLVIGPACGRFAIELGPRGGVREVINRLTDRWLPGPFDRFIGAPDPPLRGYWFWNQGETFPFAWEPHTYHAFAAALGLLELPLPDPGTDPPLVVWDDPAGPAWKILTTLAPRVGSRLPTRSREAGAIEVEGRWDARRLALRAERARDGVEVERETVFAETAGLTESDRVRLRLRLPGRRLEIEVGYARTDRPSQTTSG